MVWKLSESHNLGRWVQPTLSMVFWYGWAYQKAYADLKLPKTSGKMALLDGHTIFWKKDYDTILDAAENAIQSKEDVFFKRLCRVSENVVKRHLTIGGRFKKGKGFFKENLADLFDSWHALCVPWTMVILAAIPLEKALEKKILEENLDAESVASAVSPREKTPLMRQNLEARQFAEEIRTLGISLAGPPTRVFSKIEKKDPKLAAKMETHLEQFAWAGTHHLWGNRFGWSALIEQMAPPQPPMIGKNPGRFSANTAWLIRQSQRMAYWRQSLAEASDLTAFWARPQMQQAAKSLGMRYDDLIWLLDSEILAGLEGQKLPKMSEINLRKKAFGIASDPEGIRVIFGEELEKWLSVLVPSVDTTVTELKGTAASPGFAEGTACVCITPHDAEKIREGQILVAPQTTPDFVPFMRKAVAIVTEEGGLTCHAAIVSRELGKPCVVGTRVATRVIQNGEKIRVDATAGKIYRLNAGKAST